MKNINWKFVGTVALITLVVIAGVFYIGPVKKIVAPATPAV